MRRYQIIDDGEELQIMMAVGDRQVAGVLVSLDALDDDEAYSLAKTLGEAFKNSWGMGAQRPI